MVLMPTYYSFGLDGGTEQTGNRLQALSISVGREFPEYSISPPYRDTQLGTRTPEFEITVGKPGRPGDFEVSDDPTTPIDDPVGPSFVEDPLNELVVDQPDGSGGETDDDSGGTRPDVGQTDERSTDTGGGYGY